MDQIEVRSIQVQGHALVAIRVNGQVAYRTTRDARQLADLIVEECDVAEARPTR